jgi:GTPase
LSNKRRVPSFAEQGEVGQEVWYNIELRLLADVALVGFPNAGKSTFISRISAARPKIADYPFTTLVPNLGVVRRGEREMVVADIPGLIDGAAEGRGLGHQFLRHVERARVLLILVDLAAIDGRSPADQEAALLHELGAYRPDLLDRPRLTVGTKADYGDLEFDGVTISSVTGKNIDRVVDELLDMVTEARTAEPLPDEGFVVYRPEPEGVQIVRHDDGSWEVLGREARRAVALSDLNDPDALAFSQQRLLDLGVNRALQRAGAKDGHTVVIGSFAFEYESDQ